MRRGIPGDSRTSCAARAALLLVWGLLAAHPAGAGEVTSYFESSANKNPRGDAGLSVTGDRVRFKADLALRAPEGSTLIVPKLSSTVALSDRLGLETQVHLDEWNSRSEIPGANVDTRLRFRPSAPFLDEFEGRVWRAPDGQSGQALKLGFHQKFRTAHEPKPITVRGRASVETTLTPVEAEPARADVSVEPAGGGPVAADAVSAIAVARTETRLVRLETDVSGLLQRARGRSAVNIRLDQASGATRATTSSVAYRYSWTLAGAELGLNLKVRRTNDATASTVEPSVGLNWKWQL